MEKYWLDIRAGCCAIRIVKLSGGEQDTHLHPYLPSVVYFVNGQLKTYLSATKDFPAIVAWELSDEILVYAKWLCKQLNMEAKYEQDSKNRVATTDAMV